MTDREQIVETIARLGLLVDARDWVALRALFADRVDVDYTSLNGGSPQRLSRDDLLGGWESMLGRLAATQHVIANQSVDLDGDQARAAANVTATHVAPNSTGGPHWTVGGRYDLALVRDEGIWRITALTLTVAWATGNQMIMQAPSDD